jgi:hypothetical protein
MTDMKKPPIGIEPRFIWRARRMYELMAAITRYADAKLEIPCEWLSEIKELLNDYKFYDQPKINRDSH